MFLAIGICVKIVFHEFFSGASKERQGLCPTALCSCLSKHRFPLLHRLGRHLIEVVPLNTNTTESITDFSAVVSETDHPVETAHIL